MRYSIKNSNIISQHEVFATTNMIEQIHFFKVQRNPSHDLNMVSEPGPSPLDSLSMLKSGLGVKGVSEWVKVPH